MRQAVASCSIGWVAVIPSEKQARSEVPKAAVSSLPTSGSVSQCRCCALPSRLLQGDNSECDGPQVPAGLTKMHAHVSGTACWRRRGPGGGLVEGGEKTLLRQDWTARSEFSRARRDCDAARVPRGRVAVVRRQRTSLRNWGFGEYAKRTSRHALTGLKVSDKTFE